METVQVPVELLKKLRAYLGTRPFDEVAGGIIELNQYLQEPQTAEPVESEDKK